MSGFEQQYARSILDGALADTDYFAWSENGTSESANLARTAVGSWTAASNAKPTLKGNAAEIVTAGAGGAATISHFAVFSAATNGTRKSDWTALDSPRTLATGDKLDAAASALQVSLA